MEPSSAPGPQFPDPSNEADRALPPGIRFARGMAVFIAVFTLFFIVQSGVFVLHVVQVDPDLSALSLREALSDPGLLSALQDHQTNGDAIAAASLWSGLAGFLATLLFVQLWKRDGWKAFLGFRMFRPRALFIWSGVFIALVAVIEVLANFIPSFRSDYMNEVIGSAHSLPMLLFGVGVMPALFEETLLRGLFLGTMRHITDEHISVAVTAGVFTLMHMQYSAAILLLVLPMGVVLGYARTRSGSIWVPIILHMLNNVLSVVFPNM